MTSDWNIPPGDTLLGFACSDEARRQLAPSRIETQRVWNAIKWWLASYQHGECSLRDLLEQTQLVVAGRSKRDRTFFVGWVVDQALAMPEPKRQQKRPGLPRWQVARAVLHVEQARAQGFPVFVDGNDPGPAILQALETLRARKIHFSSSAALLAAYRKHKNKFDLAELEEVFRHDDAAERKAGFGSVTK